MVTPWRAKSPLVRDELVLTGSRAISNLSELYHGFTEYRLELLAERIRLMQKKERVREASKRPFDVLDMRKFLQEQKSFLETTIEELVEVGDDDSKVR